MEQKAKNSFARFFTAKNTAYLAVLLALVIVLQIFASAIPVGAAQLNFSLIPIVLGAILLGTWAGAFLGFACGVVVLIQVIIGSPFYTIIWTYNPIITTLICIVKTTVAGLVSGILYKVISRKNKLVAVFVASGIVPIVNTGLFILGCLCMNNAIAAFQDVLEMSSENLFVFIIIVLVSYNFFFEFAINLLLSPAIHRVVAVVEKQLGKKKNKFSTGETTSESEMENT